MNRKERASLTLALLLLTSSLLVLSMLSSVLSGYTIQPEGQKDQDKRDTEKPLPVVMFKVSPTTPRLYWSVSSADYYTGFMWLSTTNERVLPENPQFRDVNVTRIFTVELNTSQHEFSLPLASSRSEIADISIEPHEDVEVRLDAIGNVLNVRRLGKTDGEVKLVYRVSWNESELDDGLISLQDIQQIYLEKYLQLPETSADVRNVAEKLKDASYSVLDQVLADVQFLKSNFVYDVERLRSVYENANQGSDVSVYITKKKGICTDAATALAVILRIQGIPARISFGYKPGADENGQLLYYKAGGHAVTEVYLPPYGWVQFDATPPLEENPLMKASSFKKYCSIGDSVYFQLTVTNRRPSMDNFRLFVSSKQEWGVEAAPLRMWVDASQTADAFLKVTVPDYANIGEKDAVTLTVASLSQPEDAASILVIIQVGNVSRIPTTTMLRDFDGNVMRGETFQVNGDILAADNEQVDNMTTLIFVTRTTVAEGTLVGKGYSQQGSFSVKCLVPSFLDIGGYKLIPISLGTTLHAPSRAESIMKLRATTTIEFLNPNDEFLIGFGAIYGRLVWDNKTGLANQPISFKVTLRTGQSEFLEFQNLTSAQGLFRIVTKFGDPGTYDLEAKYSGNEYILGSQATRVVQLERGRPTIQISAEDIAIRGGFFNATGVLQYEDMGIWGEPLNVTLDKRFLADIETGDNGYYAFSLPVDPEEELGLHILTVAVKKGNVSVVHEFAVKSRIKSTMRVTDVAGGMFHLLHTSLSDDHGMPVPEAKVTVDGYALSGETDNNGNLAFLLDDVKLWPGNLTLAVRFDGSDLYLPAKSEETVFLAPMVSMSFLIPLVAPVLAVTLLMCAKYVVRSRRSVLPTHDLELGRSVVMSRASQNETHKAERVKILLPDVGAQFPSLWGVNEKLRIQIIVNDRALERIREKEVAVSVDNEPVASGIQFKEGLAEVSCLLTTKGEHIIRTTLHVTSESQPSTAEIMVRAVDYGEEIVRLYSEFLKKMMGDGIHARKEMTGREIEALVSETGNYDANVLHKVTACFERAEYSDYSTCRKDYETIYTSLRELKIGVD
jgi:hypothetical protein